MKYLDTRFKSHTLEKEFISQQLDGIIALHYKISVFLNLILLYVIIEYAMDKDYITPCIITLFGFFNYGQLKYFQKYPSLKCMYYINFCNLLIAIFRVFDAANIHNGTFNPPFNYSYHQGLKYMAIHLTLLVNPYLKTNLIVFLAILIVNLVVASLIECRFYYEGLVMLVFMGMYTVKLLNNLEVKRKLFQFQQKNNSWESIFKQAINQPFILIQYKKDELKFDLLKFNELAQTELSISDSISMRDTLRKMKVKNPLLSINLENLIFNLINTIHSNNGYEYFSVKEQIKYYYGQNLHQSYETTIYLLDGEQQTYILTFQSLTTLVNQKYLKQIIISQQVTLCHMIHQSYSFYKRQLKENYCSNVAIVGLKKNKEYFTNYLEIFRTRKNLQIKRIELKQLTKKIQFLFPYRKLILMGDVQHCFSDREILYRLLYNLCSFFFDDHHCTSITFLTCLKQTAGANLVTMVLTIPTQSILQQNLILADINDQQQMLKFSKIKRKSHLRFLVVRKLQSYVGPDDKIQFLDHSQGVRIYPIYNQINFRSKSPSMLT